MRDLEEFQREKDDGRERKGKDGLLRRHVSYQEESRRFLVSAGRMDGHKSGREIGVMVMERHSIANEKNYLNHFAEGRSNISFLF